MRRELQAGRFPPGSRGLQAAGVQIVRLRGVQEAKQAAELMAQWAPIDTADALELLSPAFHNPEVRAMSEHHQCDGAGDWSGSGDAAWPRLMHCDRRRLGRVPAPPRRYTTPVTPTQRVLASAVTGELLTCDTSCRCGRMRWWCWAAPMTRSCASTCSSSSRHAVRACFQAQYGAMHHQAIVELACMRLTNIL